jgi:HEAT repeat protein
MNLQAKLVLSALFSGAMLLADAQPAGQTPGDARQYAKEMIKKLDHKDPTVRKEAAKCLQACASELNENGVFKLSILINDTDPAVRREVVRALTFFGPSAARAAVPALIKALETYKSDEELRVDLIRASGGTGMYAKRALPQLTALLDDPSPMIRRSVAIVLRSLSLNDVTEILPLLIQSHDDPDKGTAEGVSVSQLAKLSVKQLGPDAVAVVSAIRKIQREEHAKVITLPREAVGQGQGKDRKLLPFLAEILKAKGDKSLRQSAAYALGIMGPDAVAAFPALIDALDVTDVKDAQLAARIQVAVIWALGQVGTGLEPMLTAVGAAAKSPDAAVRAQAEATMKKLRAGN